MRSNLKHSPGTDAPIPGGLHVLRRLQEAFLALRDLYPRPVFHDFQTLEDRIGIPIDGLAQMRAAKATKASRPVFLVPLTRGANVSPTLQFEIVLFSDILTAPPSVELLQIEEGGR